MLKVITFGTFDLFHLGHLRILERAKKLGDLLIVGVSSDQLNYKKKKKFPIYSENERMSLVQSLRCVDNVFLEESLEQKSQYISMFNADILVMGDDWKGRFDKYKAQCEVIYLPRTPSISTTSLVEKIQVSCTLNHVNSNA